MSVDNKYTVIDGIRCFSPDVASSYDDYPDGGFDLTEEHANSGFWVRSRNRLFKRLVSDQMLPAGKTKML